MSYKITYGSSRFDRIKKGKPQIKIILGAIFLLALLLTPVRNAVGNLLLPQDQQTAMKDAYGVFENVLEQGSGIGEAVTAFCAHIIDHAENTYEE